MGTIYQSQLKIKTRVTKSKMVKRKVAIRENVKNRCRKTGKLTKNKYIYRLASKTETMYVN